MESKMSRYKQPYSLYKRGNYWYYKTYSPDGVRTAGKTTGCTSKNQARLYCDQLYKDGNLWSHEIKYAEYTKTFFEADGLYFTDRQTPVTPNTIMQYKSIQRNHLLPYFKNINIRDINYTTIKTFRLFLVNKNYSVKTITLIMTVLKIVIEYAFRDRLILTDPFIYIRPLKRDDNFKDAFTLDEVKMIYTRIDDRLKNLILCVALTGMRLKESIDQTQADIVESDGFYYLDLKHQKYGKTHAKLKHNSVREIPIIPEIIPLIKYEYSLRLLYDYLVPLQKECENAEKRNLTFHSLRHFFITNSKSSGVPPIKVEYLAGHSLKGQEQIYTNFKAFDCLEILKWQKKTYKYITE